MIIQMKEIAQVGSSRDETYLSLHDYVMLTGSSLSAGIITGIVFTVLLLIVAITMTVVLCIRRLKERRALRAASALHQNPGLDYFGGPPGDPGPPPEYTESINASTTSMATLTVSISYPAFEPPPSYDIAITTRPTVPSYTAEAAPSFDQVEAIERLCQPRQRTTEVPDVDIGDTSLTGRGALGPGESAV